MTALHFLLTAYGFLGLIYWLWILVGVFRVVRAVPVLADVDAPSPSPWHFLSVVIPARNEADTLRRAMETLLQQDYPSMEVVLVNDRSTDGTGRVADDVAASDGRVKVVHVDELPEGWLGKVNALAVGARHAGGEWLLFTDADVHFAPDAIRKAVAFAEARSLDHLAAAPDLIAPTILVDAIIQAFLRSFVVSLRLWAVESPGSQSYAGVGAFNLVRREMLERTPGFEWLRLEVADDIGLGLMIKQSGGRSALAHARTLVSVTWYPTFAAAARGAEKGFASIGHCSVFRMLLVSAAVPLLELAPVVALAVAVLPAPNGIPGMWPAAAMMLAAAIASIAMVGRWSRRRFLPGLLMPVAVLMATYLLLRTTWLGWHRGGIAWRDTLYPSRLLQGKLRVRFP